MTLTDAPGRALLVTADPDLLDDVLRLAMAAGVEVEVAGHAAAAARAWHRASMVLVGTDLSGEVAASGPRRRPGVLLLTREREPAEGDWRAAVALGAEHVVATGPGEPWLVERLAECDRPPGPEAPVLALVGGRGGAGVSTLACAVAQRAASRGCRTALIDLDPWGGGLDVLAGLEEQPGLRWPELSHTSGRLSPSALAAALPREGALSVLSWDRGPASEVAPGAVGAVIDSAARGFELVVLDLARPHPPPEALRRTGLLLLVVPREFRAVAAAHRAAQLAADHGAPTAVLTRGPSPSDLAPADVAASLGLALVADLRSEARVAAAAERGEPLAARGQIARVVDAVLAEVRGPVVP